MTQPDFLDAPPQDEALTDYDRRHLKLYLRLLDAQADGADWREIVSVLFGLDPSRDAEHACSVYEAHLSRARWMTQHGYRDLLSRG